MGYQLCSKSCGLSIENYSNIFRQTPNTEGSKMGYFHVTLTVLLSIAILFAMTFHEASATNGGVINLCPPEGCPPGENCEFIRGYNGQPVFACYGKMNKM